MRRKIVISVLALNLGALVAFVALTSHWPLWLSLLAASTVTFLAARRPRWFVLPDLRELMFDHALRELRKTTPPGTPLTEAVIALTRYHFGVPVPDGEAVHGER